MEVEDKRVSVNTSGGSDAGIIWIGIVILILFLCGEPSLLDAIIHCLMK